MKGNKIGGRENRTFKPPIKPNDWPVIDFDLSDEQFKAILRLAKEKEMTFADFIRYLIKVAIEYEKR